MGSVPLYLCTRKGKLHQFRPGESRANEQLQYAEAINPAPYTRPAARRNGLLAQSSCFRRCITCIRTTTTPLKPGPGILGNVNGGGQRKAINEDQLFDGNKHENAIESQFPIASSRCAWCVRWYFGRFQYKPGTEHCTVDVMNV